MNNFKILGITQTNEKYFFKDVKIKTILEETGYKTAKPIFRDLKNGVLFNFKWLYSFMDRIV